MKAHPNADGHAVGPRVPCKRRLRIGCGLERTARVSEHHEKAVSLRIDLNAAVARERLA